MQARAFPPCLPGPGRNDLFLGSVGKRAPAVRVRAVDGPSAAAAVADLPPAEVTWQIVVGAVAGVTPFVVAGVEFGKRIIEQKKCEVCGGSGLVMKEDLYVRCQGCDVVTVCCPDCQVGFFHGSRGEDSSKGENHQSHVTSIITR